MKMVKSNLGREFSPVHDLLRDMMLRGYRTEDEYQSIHIENSKYNTYIRQIKTMLNEYPEVLVEEKKDGKKVYHFRNEPMKWQNNPLAEVWGYVMPRQEELHMYMHIFQFLHMYKESSLSRLADDYEAELTNYYGLEIDFEKEKEQGLLEEAEVDEEDDKKYSESALKQRVRRVLKKMEKQGLIFSRRQDGELIYFTKTAMWDFFSDKEIIEIWHYLSFLRNVMPFELPYVLLQRNLELWLRKTRKYQLVEQQKEIFLFRHRNPINVLDTEAICGFFCFSDSKKTNRVQINSPLYEFHSPQYWIDNKRISNRQSDDTINRKVPAKYAIEDNLGNGEIYFNCRTGELFYEKKEGLKTIIPKGVRYYHTKSQKDGISENVSTMPEMVQSIFNQGNSIYLQRLAELCYVTKKEWKEEELKQHFFRGEEEYFDVFEELAPKDNNYNSCFDYDSKRKVYRWKSFLKDVFYIPQLAREAFWSISDLEYTQYFLNSDLVKKIQEVTKKKTDIHWNTKHLHWLEQKSEKREDKYSDIRTIIMVCFRERGYIFDKAGRKYDLIRIQYSIYHDAFRLLVRDCVDGSIKFLELNQVDVNKIDLAQVNRRRNMQNQFDWQSQVDEMMKEKTIIFTRDASSAFFDNQLSEHILMALSSYEHKTTYSNENPDEQAGELEIVLKYWPDDEAELEEELRLLSNQCGVKDSVNLLFNPYFIGKDVFEKEVKKEVFFYKY